MRENFVEIITLHVLKLDIKAQKYGFVTEVCPWYEGEVPIWCASVFESTPYGIRAMGSGSGDTEYEALREAWEMHLKYYKINHEKDPATLALK